MRLFILSLVLLVISGCVTERKRQRICNSCPEKVITKVETTETVRDSITHDTIVEPADSAFYYLYLQCKDGSKPEIKKEAKKDGKRTKTSKTYNEKTGQLVFKCNSDSLQREIEIKNKIIERLKREVVTQTIKDRGNNNDLMKILYFIFIVAVLYLILHIFNKLYGKKDNL
jgi:hypothetical protein